MADTELGDFCGPPARVPSDVTESAFSFSCQTLKLPGVHRMIRSGRKKNGTLVRAGDQNETPDGGRAGAAPAAPGTRAPHPRRRPRRATVSLAKSASGNPLTLTLTLILTIKLGGRVGERRPLLVLSATASGAGVDAWL